jgi:hypothetical protein
MARRSNLPNLVVDAFEHSESTASNRNWRATRMGNYVGVEHHGTHMFNVSRAGVVEPVNRGWGSMTDRCGVRRITAGFGCGSPQGIGYRELYDDEPMNRMSGDQWRNAIDRSSWTSEPRSGRAPVGDPSWARLSDLQPGIRATIGDPVPAGRGWSRTARAGVTVHAPPTHSGLPGDDFSYSDMNRRGPNYDEPDPFDFSDPEEARQAQSITDMEETLRGLDERSQRPRNDG